MENETNQIFVLTAPAGQMLVEPHKTAETAQVNLQDANLLSVCRTCATVTNYVIPIFSGEGLQNNLADKIHKHLPIQVSSSDLLPQAVCYQCASTLLAWHELVACCVQADAALRTRARLHAAAAAAAADKLQAQNLEQPPLPSNNVNETEETTKGREPLEQQKELQTKSENALYFYKLVRSVLVDSLRILNSREQELDFEFVCQKCDRMRLGTVGGLAEHLLETHENFDLKMSITTFIEENITFEEILILSSTEEEDNGNDLEDAAESADDVKPELAITNYFCPFCDSIFSSCTRLIWHLNCHVDSCVGEGFLCRICEHSFPDKKSFVQHLQETHVFRATDRTQLTCRACGHTATDHNNLCAHIEDAHPDEKYATKPQPHSSKDQKYIPVSCPECQKTFSNKYNMQIHLKSHFSDGCYTCDKCPKSYKSRANLRKHSQLVHEGRLEHSCRACGEKFATRTARDIHSRLHTGERPYSCPTCDKRFRAKNTLDRHLETHLDIRNYKCHVCPKKFRKRTHLDYHLGTHSKAAPT